jgi:hypothetical protein
MAEDDATPPTDFSRYLYPPREITEAVNALLLYYQILDRESVRKYIEWKDTGRFKGDIGQLDKLLTYQEMFENVSGKPWETVFTAVQIVDRFRLDWNSAISEILKMGDQGITDFFNVIKSGVLAYKKLMKWLEPIMTKEIARVMHDSVKFTIGYRKWDTFVCLKVADVPTDSTGPMKFYGNIVEVEDPFDVVEILSFLPSGLHDGLALTYSRNGSYPWRIAPYIFLVYRNAIYVFDGSDHRLDLENPAGARGSGMGSMANFVWLPWQLMTTSYDESMSMPILKDKKAFVRGKMDDVLSDKNYFVWLSMFVSRAVDFIENHEIEKAYGVKDVLLLPDMNRNATDISGKDWGENQHGAEKNADLVKFFSDKLNSLTPASIDLSRATVIGTKQHITSFIQYNQRKALAGELARLLKEDYALNGGKLANWFHDTVEEFGVERFIDLALMDGEYPYTEVRDEWPFRNNPRIVTESVLEYKAREEAGAYLTEGNTENRHVFNKGDTCALCGAPHPSIYVGCRFRDYRQFSSFFGMKALSLPERFMLHFTTQRHLYTGNEILEDVDPVLLVDDPYPGNYSVGAFICNSCDSERLGKWYLRQKPEERHYGDWNNKEGWGSIHRRKGRPLKLHYIISGRILCKNDFRHRNVTKHSLADVERLVGGDPPNAILCQDCRKRLKERFPAISAEGVS